jgi:hypothetical protein
LCCQRSLTYSVGCANLFLGLHLCDPLCVGLAPRGSPHSRAAAIYYDTCHSKFQPYWDKNRKIGVK